MSDDAQQTLELLVEHELAIKRLYLAYAAVFTDVRQFWLNLADDEQGHADTLGSLMHEPALRLWLADGSGVKPQAVRSSISYIQAQTSKAHEGSTTLLQALVVANDVEEALIDKRWVLPSDPQCAEIGRVLSELKSQTERHRRLVAEALATEKRLHTQAYD